MPVSDYDEMVTRYVEKYYSKHGFVFRKGKIERYNAKIARSTIERLCTAAKVIDLAIRPEERGGSADQLRIWVLVEHQKSRRIVELKQYSKPAIANYQAQPPVHEWLNEIRRTFWPGLDGSAYDLIDLPGAGLFWIREKHVSLIDLPYSSKKSSEIAFLDNIASYAANVLGLAHGRQAEATHHPPVVEKHPNPSPNAPAPAPNPYLHLPT